MEAKAKEMSAQDVIKNLVVEYYLIFNSSKKSLDVKKKESEKYTAGFYPLPAIEKSIREIESLSKKVSLVSTILKTLYQCKTLNDLKKAREFLNTIFRLTTVEEERDLLEKAVKKIDGFLPLETTEEVKLDLETEIQLAVLHSEVFSAKLEAKQIDQNNEEQIQLYISRLNELEGKREAEVARLTSAEEARFILSDIRRMEDNVINAIGVVRAPAYFLTPENFKYRLDQLNEMIEDLKFNRDKSRTFYRLHERDHKKDSASLAKDILRLSHEREDIILSVLDGDSSIAKVYRELVASEGLFNTAGGYEAFRRQNGKVGEEKRSFSVYKKGSSLVLKCRETIENALREALEQKGAVQIVSTAPTYETEKEKRDLAYQKMWADIKRYREGKETRKKREEIKQIEAKRNMIINKAIAKSRIDSGEPMPMETWLVDTETGDKIRMVNSESSEEEHRM